MKSNFTNGHLIQKQENQQHKRVDLGKRIDFKKYTEIHQAWLDFQVLVFPDQNISEEDQIRFTKHWGEMPRRKRYGGRPEEGRRSHESIMLISNIILDN